MAKKITIVLIFILAALGTFLASYLISRRGNSEQNQQALIDNSLINRFQKPSEKHALATGPFVLSEGTAKFPEISFDGKSVLYYDSAKGEVRSVLLDGSGNSVLVAKIQPGATDISWSSNKTLVATYPTGSIYYNIGSGFSKKLDTRAKGAVLSHSDKLAYDYFDESASSGEIRVADAESEGYKKVMPTEFEGWQMEWVGNNELALIKPPTSASPTYWLFTLDIDTGRLERILDSKNNLWVRWSPNGQKIVYSYTDPSTQESGLYFMDLSNQEEVKLNTTSRVSDCVWSIDNKNVYCANGVSFVSFDTSSADSSLKTLSAQNSDGSAVDATGLTLSSTESYLIFLNASNGRLYAIPTGQ